LSGAQLGDELLTHFFLHNELKVTAREARKRWIF